MNKIINDLIEAKLFELLEQSAYEELAVDEKELVDNHFSEEEYRAQREMMIELEEIESLEEAPFGSARGDEGFVIEPPILPTDKVENSDSKIKQLLTFKVPGYAVAMFLIIAFAVPYFFRQKDIESNNPTIANESIIKENLKNSVLLTPEEKLVKEAASPVLVADSVQSDQIKTSIDKALNKPKGKSAKSNPYPVFFTAL